MSERRYVIRTSRYVWRVKARGHWAALRKAWQARPPKSVGVLVQMEPEGQDTMYCLAHVALRKAGFRVKVPTLKQYMEAIR